MHYWFIAAAFFAFHLLLAYLVDHVSVHVGVRRGRGRQPGLVVSYLRLVTGMRHALLPCRRGAARVPGALQLRVLLRGLHRAGDHDRRHRDALRPDADDGAGVVGRCVRAAEIDDQPCDEGGHASRG